MNKLVKRPRRLRTTSAIRDLVAENSLSANDFITPLFVLEGEGQKKEIASMPGYWKKSWTYRGGCKGAMGYGA